MNVKTKSLSSSVNEKAENLARDIYNWCMKKELWEDTCIYFDGKAWASWNDWHDVKGKKIDKDLYEYESKDPKKYFEWVADPHILSMSFEGTLNHVLNGYLSCSDTYVNSFEKLFKKYGMYYEMGDSWNLTVALE